MNDPLLHRSSSRPASAAPAEDRLHLVVAVRIDGDPADRVRFGRRGRDEAPGTPLVPSGVAGNEREARRREVVAARLVNTAIDWRSMSERQKFDGLHSAHEIMVIVITPTGSWAGDVPDAPDLDVEALLGRPSTVVPHAAPSQFTTPDLHVRNVSRIGSRLIASFTTIDEQGRDQASSSYHRVLPEQTETVATPVLPTLPHRSVAPSAAESPAPVAFDAGVEAEPKPEPESELEPEPETESESELELEPEPEPEFVVDPDAVHTSTPDGAVAVKTSASSAQWRLHVLCLVALGLIVALRYSIFARGGAPATIDSGNWLAFAEPLFGGVGRDPSIVYPPAIPVMVHLSVLFFGLTSGIALIAAVSSLAPAIGLYVALTLARVGPLRVVPVLLVAGLGSVGEAASWGGFPQLWSMGLLPIGVVLAMRTCDEPDRKQAIGVGAVLMVALAVSHLGALVLVCAIVTTLAVDTVARRDRDRLRAVLRLTPFAVLPSIWLVPTYLKLIDAVIFNPNEFATFDNLTLGTTVSGLENLYPELPALWQMLIPLGLTTPLLTVRHRHTLAWRSTTALILAVVLLLVVTREGRYLYFVPFVVAAALGVWADTIFRADRERTGHVWGRATVTVAIVAAVLITWQFQFAHRNLDDQRNFYGRLTPELVTAIEVAAGNGEPDSRIAVTSLNDAPIGWWVEGLTTRDVIYGSPLRWLNFADEVGRATTANAIFEPTFPNDESLGRLHDANVSTVILPTKWAFYDPDTVDAWIEDNDLDVVFDSRGARVIDVGLEGVAESP